MWDNTFNNNSKFNDRSLLLNFFNDQGNKILIHCKKCSI